MSRPFLLGHVVAARLPQDSADMNAAEVDVMVEDGADEPVITLRTFPSELRRYPAGARVVLELRPVRKGE